MEKQENVLVEKIARLIEGGVSPANGIKDQREKLNHLESQISHKSKDINSLIAKRDEFIKSCLMDLHARKKKEYQKVNEDHERYIELYTQAREEKHVIERELINLKFLVHKNYNVRLI